MLALPRTRSAIPSTLGGRLFVVQSYDAATQTVDVVAKDDPDAAIIRGVRIANGADPAGLSIGRAFKSIEADGEAEATVGYVVYPESDAGGSLLDRLRRKAFGSRRFASLSPLFLASFRATSDGVPHGLFDDADAAGTDPEVIGPNDEWWMSRWGQVVVFKKNGDVVHRYPGNAYFFGTNQAFADMEPVAREGDSVSGGTTISSGSNRVKVA